MKQIFKRETLTKKKCVNSILRFYNEANINEIKEGMNWYNDANRYCRELAERFNLSVSQIAGIISAFSPQTGWQENKRFTVSFLLNRKVITKCKIQTDKARKIVTLSNELDIYNALSTTGRAFKTKAFFLNMLNPDLKTSVTIDRHAIASLFQTPKTVAPLPDKSYKDSTKKQYEFFERCYIEASKELNILPQQLQAIVWTVYRRLRELREYDNNNELNWKPFISESF